ncbi:MAG TPA: CAP domain-containing protein [Micromonosporaceae bacterium]|nr:CAP domain-containing protein [Micromonosporaceae bacterium]
MEPGAASRRRSTAPVRAYAALGLLVAALAVGGAGAAVRGTTLLDGGGEAPGRGAAGSPDGYAGPSASSPARVAQPPGAPAPATSTPATATPTATPNNVPTGVPAAGGAGAPAATRSRSRVEVVEDEVVVVVNRERQARGCGPVRIDDRLRAAAGAHSADMAAHERMSHTGSDGSSPWDRARRAGYAYAMSENVAYGYRTAAEVMRGWMASPGHRTNILDCDARAVGVGLAYSRGGTAYWTQMFGSR